MHPAPRQVLDTVKAVLAAEWPTTDLERRELFERLGVAPAGHFSSWENWGQDIPGWGTAVSCWSFHRDELVGFGWFLWREADKALFDGQCAELESLLVEHFGAPAQEERHHEGVSMTWSIDGRRVEFFTRQSVYGGEPSAQVHVVDAARADRQEREASEA